MKLDNDNEADLKIYKAEQVKIIKDVAAKEELEPDIDIDELKQLED